MEWMSKGRPGSGAAATADNQEPVTPRWGFAVSSGILGWILDAFDFFVLVFLVDVLANNFHVSKAEIVWTITITLATPPFAPSFACFVVRRALYGMGMGGYWGIGVSLVMEISPSRWRGLFSGIMQ